MASGLGRGSGLGNLIGGGGVGICQVYNWALQYGSGGPQRISSAVERSSGDCNC